MLEGMLYLITRPADEVMQWPIDVGSLRNYVRVPYGAEHTWKDKVLAFAYLKRLALQPNNISLGWTRYIIDDAGYPLWALEVVLQEVEYGSHS